MSLKLIEDITIRMDGIQEITLDIPSHKFNEYFHNSNNSIKEFMKLMATKYRLQITMTGDYFGNRTLKVVRQ